MQRQVRNIESNPLPHSIELEMTILGTSLIESVVLDMAIEKLHDDDFYMERCKDLFNIMRDMVKYGGKVDLLSLNTQLELLNRTDLLKTIDDVMDKFCAVENAESHIETMSKMGVLRRLITVASEISRMCYNFEGDFDEVVDKSETMLHAATERAEKSDESSASEILADTFDHMEKMHRGVKFGITTGFKKLDDELCGLEPDQFIVLAGRPSMGKTSFALCMAMEQAINHKIPVAIFSLEMPKLQFGQRMIANWARVNMLHMRQGTMSKDNYAKIAQVTSDIANAPIYVDDTPLLSLNSFRSKLRKMISKYGVKFVIVDYLQLMQRDEKLDTNASIEKISRGMKITAKNFHIPVMVLSQMSRAIDKRTKGDKRPILSDLRDSGAIEQDADVVLFVHRQCVYDKEAPKDDAEIIIAKQRNGPVGTVHLEFDSDSAAFSNGPNEPYVEREKEEW